MHSVAFSARAAESAKRGSVAISGTPSRLVKSSQCLSLCRRMRLMNRSSAVR